MNHDDRSERLVKRLRDCCALVNYELCPGLVNAAHEAADALSAVPSLAATTPRYLVYPFDKGQTHPHFTDEPLEHDGSEGELNVLVDLHTGQRKAFDEWGPVERYRCHSAPVSPLATTGNIKNIPGWGDRQCCDTCGAYGRDRAFEAHCERKDCPATRKS